MRGSFRIMLIGSAFLLCPALVAAAPHAIAPASLPEVVAPKVAVQTSPSLRAIIDTTGDFRQIIIPQSEQIPKWRPASHPEANARDMPARA